MQHAASSVTDSYTDNVAARDAIVKQVNVNISNMRAASAKLLQDMMDDSENDSEDEAALEDLAKMVSRGRKNEHRARGRNVR